MRWLNFPVEDDPSTPADESKFVTPCNCRPDELTGDLLCVHLGAFDPTYTVPSYRGLARIHSSFVNGYIPHMKMVLAFDVGTGFVEKCQQVPGTRYFICLINGIQLPGENAPTWAALKINIDGYNDYTVFARFPGAGVLASVAIDDEGLVYITDTLYKKIYQVNADGSNSHIWVDSQYNLGYFGLPNPWDEGMGVNGNKFNVKRKGLEAVVFNTGAAIFIPKLADGSAGQIHVQYADISKYGFVEMELDASEKYKFSGRFLNNGEIARIIVKNDNKPATVEWIIIPNSEITENTHIIPTTGMSDPLLEGCLLAMSLGLNGDGHISVVFDDDEDPSTGFYTLPSSEL
jgi:hypothetical protein